MLQIKFVTFYLWWKFWKNRTKKCCFTTGCEKSIFFNKICAWCPRIIFFYKFTKEVFFVSCMQYNMMCTHMAQYTLFFLRLKFFLKLLKNMLFYNRIWNFKKWEKKEGGRGGVLKKKYPPIRFRKLHTFRKCQVYRVLGKCL